MVVKPFAEYISTEDTSSTHIVIKKYNEEKDIVVGDLLEETSAGNYRVLDTDRHYPRTIFTFSLGELENLEKIK